MINFRHRTNQQRVRAFRLEEHDHCNPRCVQDIQFENSPICALISVQDTFHIIRPGIKGSIKGHVGDWVVALDEEPYWLTMDYGIFNAQYELDRAWLSMPTPTENRTPPLPNSETTDHQA